MPRLNRIPGFNKAVRAAMMPKFVYRMRFLAFTATQNANTVLPLLTCVSDSDPDYDQLIDGTSPAECVAGARLLAMQMHFQVVPGATPGDLQGEILEWVLMKDPDGVLAGAATQSISTLYTQDLTTSTKIIRKYAMAAGHIVFSSNFDSPSIRVNVPSKVLRRVGPFQENDALKIVFTVTAASASPVLYGRGRIITRQG